MTVDTNLQHEPSLPALLDRRRVLDCCWIFLAWAAPAALLHPFQNTPFVDDWVYAWPVQRLLAHGDLRLLDYSGSLNLVQVLWGALFCLPFGFSFTALRLSTWLCGAVCLWSTYLLLQELRVSRRDSLIATAALGAYPIFFVLSYTFMTDVPFLAAMIGSLLAFVRALRRQHNGWLAAAVSCAALSVGIRVIGLVLPVAMMMTLLVHAGPWGRRRARFLWPLAVFAFFGLLAWWHHGHIERIADLTWIENAPQRRLRDLRLYGWRLLPSMTVCTATFLAGAIGLALLPLVAAWTRGRRRLWSVLVFAALGLLVLAMPKLHQSYLPPLAPHATWALEELGATEPLVPGFEAFSQPRWFVWSISTAAFASFSLLLGGLLRRARREHAFFWWVILIQFLLFSLLWLFYDRYALSLLPLFTALLLSADELRRPRLAISLLGVMALDSFLGVRDHLNYNRALWQAVDEMGRLAPISQIDGGYVVNGWLQYAHPENAPRDAAGAVAVPMMNVRSRLPYRIANRPLQGYHVIRSIPYRRWLGRSGSIWLLEQDRPSR